MDTVKFGHLLRPPVSSLSCHFRFAVYFYGSVFRYCYFLDSLQLPLSKSGFPVLYPDVLLSPLVSDGFKRYA